MMKKLSQLLVTTAGLILLWQAFITLTHTPPYLLPGPLAVFKKLIAAAPMLAKNTLTTSAEILISLAIGIVLGVLTALLLYASLKLRQWLHPVILASQAVPVYALGPILMLWFGYGLTPKIIIAVIIIYFPITTAAYDGLRSTPPHYVNLAKTMNAGKLATLLRIRLPAALPHFASGIRTAVVITPIAAIIGEYIGGSSGLGYVMQYSINRSQTDLTFAAVIIISAYTLLLYAITDFILSKLIHWK